MAKTVLSWGAKVTKWVLKVLLMFMMAVLGFYWGLLAGLRVAITPFAVVINGVFAGLDQVGEGVAAVGLWRDAGGLSHSETPKLFLHFS